MKDSELAPCVFCGSKKAPAAWDDIDGWFVICRDWSGQGGCGASGPRKSSDWLAIKAWGEWKLLEHSPSGDFPGASCVDGCPGCAAENQSSEAK